jgi:vanillate O-demethylase ferredoxin subunit
MSNAPELQVRVARKRAEAQDICSFELVEPQGRTLPAFTAGAHLDVHAGAGLVRQYSLCQPHDQTGRYVIAVLREPASRGGSKAMHDDVHEGD